MRGPRRCPASRSIAVLALVLGGLAPDAGAALNEEAFDLAARKQAGQAVISADEITYDESLGAVNARGNVEIAHGERILLADSVRYDQRADTVVASGEVVLLEPNGEVIFADYVELSDEMRSGVIENIRILLADDSRFAANGARRIDGTKTVMRRAVYSPCNVCAAEPDRPPVWQIKAGTIVHDQETRDVTYSNAWLELYGVPVAYTPYLTHPDPTVDRRSGLLTPRFGTSTLFGAYIRTPYFWEITDSVDVTIEPIVTTKQPPILSLEYRQRFNSGSFETSGSVTRADRETGDSADPTIEKDVTRGHLFSEARFDLNDDWRWGFDYRRATDRTYLDRYDFFGDPGETLESSLFLEGFHGRSYSNANIIGYQDLRLTDPVDEPLVLPMIDHNLITEADRLGGRWSLDSNFRSTMRDDGGPNTRRLSLKGGYLASFIADIGLVTTVSASLQADAYHLDRANIDGQQENNAWETRGVPRLAAELRYPFVRGADGIRQLVEPVVAVIAAPNIKNPANIPPEDNPGFELDDTNLFQEDRIPGLDRVETGQRVVYGMRGGLYGERGGRLTGFVGQSYRLDDNGAMASEIGIEQGRSDYVGRLEAAPNKYLDLLYRFRAAEDDLQILRSELGVTVGPPAFKVTGDYIFIASEASAGLFPDREELSVEFTSQLSDFWSMGLHMRRDLTSTGGTLEHGVRITYEDECFKLDASFKRDFTSSTDIEEENIFSVELVFKNLGNVTAKQSQVN